ncbi:MAG: PLP-dependent aminotransferase family protein [Bryobacteraceae bacterium]|jgi:DNA-binding transcriptional MocR family regulator
MDALPHLDHGSDVPLYRQLYEQFAERIRSGEWGPNQRLPATRELAESLGLNRTTVAAAYEMLEAEGMIAGKVGKGSFVTGAGGLAGRGPAPQHGLAGRGPAPQHGLAGRGPAPLWGALLERREAAPPSAALGRETISFATSWPSRELFPLDEFRLSCAAVLSRADLADILQLGSPAGYEPLRRYLLKEAHGRGEAGAADDLLITNGCQQGLDLLGRVLLRPGDAVAVEDPVYPGLKNLLIGMGARLAAVPVGADGMEIPRLVRVLERERPKLIVVTPDFQNPTGATLPLEARRGLLAAARAAGVPVVENDPYSELRYEGQPIDALKRLDQGSGTVLLRSFSKASFPGLRVGWVVGPKPLLDRLRHAKEAADLHSDQLSQAVLLEFAESGRLEAHRKRLLEAGGERLRVTLEACREFLPPGTRWTRPEGGMNLWVSLPEPLDAGELLPRAQKLGVTYLPARYFSVSRHEPGGLRLSFAGLEPRQIRDGLAIIGDLAAAELASARPSGEPAPAMV